MGAEHSYGLVTLLLAPVFAFVISVFTASGGISGAFLLLPFQMSVLGITSPSVSATNQLYNIVAIPGGVYRYIKEGRMVWPLVWIVVAGTLPGVFAGAVIRLEYLPDPSDFKIFAGVVLLNIGGKLIWDMIRKGSRQGGSAEKKFEGLVRSFRSRQAELNDSLPRVKVNNFSLKTMSYEFYGENFSVPTMSLFAISLIVGIVGGIYGIGGGAIIAPVYVTFFHLPVFTVSGAALMGTFITSIAGVVFYELLAPFYPGLNVAPDWLLGFLFGIGGLSGIYIGARLQKYMRAAWIKWILSLAIIIMAAKYLYEIVKNFI